ncbi:hypothetical protein CC99x_000520 [Candidatus Berkiella cookevillensis]|uniref:Uncharacterized protein n=1 Tax=Candidatus Berkiella cookevillensis TaxID=437022 RepID=A0A0Q9YCP2_9GAMM|nr:hypothetical protein [Candidatus Berkiella cookevillensis]MCS5707377.1 hypothetical protein [Candidatus Berkiella cookevillensis]
MLKSVVKTEDPTEDLSSPLSRLALQDGSEIVYQVDSLVAFEVERKTDFALKNYVQDATEYLLLTTLPTVDALNELSRLPPSMQDRIFKTLQQVYSHVTERVPSENTEHYFCHVAATVYYEEHTKIDIKGRQHYKKASSLTKMLETTIEEINKLMKNKLMSPEQVELLQQYHHLFSAHNNACHRALQLIADYKKSHLTIHQNHEVDSYKPVPLSPGKKARVQSIHPETSPVRPGKLTPKKLSKADKDSIDRLRSGVRLDFGDTEDLSSSEEEVVPSRTKKVLPIGTKKKRKLWNGSDDGSSDDDFLWQQGNKGMTLYFDAIASKDSKIPMEEKSDISADDSFDFDSDSDWEKDPESADSDAENNPAIALTLERKHKC